MTKQQLVIFIRLAETGSVSQIAREMGISQPTVTFHLKKLTDETGVKLYERRGEQIDFTTAGKMMLRYAKNITSLYDEADRVMREFREDKRGEILVGASHVPANYLLPPVFQRFMEENSTSKLSVSVKSAPEIIEDVRQKKLDLAVISTTPVFDHDLFSRVVTGDPVELVMPLDHDLAKKEHLFAEDLGQFPFILQPKGATRAEIINWEAKNGLSLNVAMELSNIDAVLKMVALGSGLSILSKRAAVQAVADGILTTRPLPHFDNTRSITIIYRKDRTISERMQTLITLIFQEKISSAN
ncbi:LysR family transcriptional regulator [Salisediminibacterium halotolerans]|uniref:DNA-binding transcriptional regulator, LysR family n=1 Tax=Salisediminibacterium halotolerans TaxID=517425 RepID=A0A1H9VJJ4_9BACI|nr:LysR family transcriptional regulator [Salisediminibacterium haloalkalitolerans]SES21754.1 DNA-binding transcriptional regulator, LysR family [Salisediminibacterium haloalkalitolerans]